MLSWWNDRKELCILLNISRQKGVGITKIRRLISYFQSPSKILSATTKSISSLDGFSESFAQGLKEFSEPDFGEEQFKKAELLGVDIVCLWDENYPQKLQRIADPPIFLFVKGNRKILDSFSIGVVGSRTPTSYGKSVATKISSDLAKKSVVVVSGLARGIDTEAHKATVNENGKTIAVLGSGLDVIYPYENRNLADEITKKGCLVSEFAFGTAPDAMNFPKRNRIISGLSDGTLVVEAGQKSGALITAYLALEQNREVFAVPGSIFSTKQTGPHSLLKEGAKLVTDVDDILSEFPSQGELFNDPREQQVHDNLTEDERLIVEILSNGPVHIDLMSQKMNKPSAILLATLLHLELSGIVVQQPGKMFVLIR